jgi:hypothetical protein
MSPQHFAWKSGDLPGEQVSGIMDERPELDRGRLHRSEWIEARIAGMTRVVLIYASSRPGGPSAKRQPSPEGLGTLMMRIASAVGAALLSSQHMFGIVRR